MRRRTLLAVAAAAVLGACDDQIKYIPVFSTMSTQPSVEAYENAGRPRVAGTMSIDADREYTLFEADTMLVNPTSGSAGELARGQEQFDVFCTPCHGSAGLGDGTVVGPNRLPPLPTLNVTSDLTRGYSDGYIWGMITNGRGVMPSYRRIPAAERWLIVNYVRQLQREAAAGGDQ
ncbi:MAG: cytochrome c [Gemmatimonadota bacterium]|nr:cytochrome c [Gemmatimonadota bacterium]